MTDMAESTYLATRITRDSAHDFEETRARFDRQVPLLKPDVTVELVMAGATREEVTATITPRTGPTGLIALARLDQGALLSLSGQPLAATLYLVGNPLTARQLTEVAAGAALYTPFRVAVFRDEIGVHIAYDQPSSVFGSLRSDSIDRIAIELDAKIAAAAEYACLRDTARSRRK
jgi:hypothetical protein